MELKNNNITGIMFSLHSADEKKHNWFMGNENAYDIMKNAVELCHKLNINTVLNIFLMKEDFYNGTFEQIMEVSKELGVSIIRILKPRPSGEWLGKEKLAFSTKDLKIAKSKISKYNSDREFKYYPSISAQIIDESKDVFGCTAGGTGRFYINAKGDVQPCEFLNISFGNVVKQNFDEIYKSMRKVFEVSGSCMLCEKYSKRVLSLYKNNELESLPLSPKLSKEVYANWNIGQTAKVLSELENKE
jgi:MoaA/NifB/PqqE/SkfB family radical SAM enzyme